MASADGSPLGDLLESGELLHWSLPCDSLHFLCSHCYLNSPFLPVYLRMREPLHMPASDHMSRYTCQSNSEHTANISEYMSEVRICVLLVVEVKAFQWNVRPRWGRNFWKFVRCCVQLVFIMFLFSPIDCLSWVFHGYHADGCSYSLVFWEFCTSLVAPSVVQDSYKHRRILGRCYNKCLWGKARMGSAYHFNLLM